MKKKGNKVTARLIAFVGGLIDRYASIELLVLLTISRHAETALRGTIGIVFVWFGVLKLIGRSPAASLVTITLEAFGMGFPGSVLALGIAEVMIGIMLCLGLTQRFVLLLFAVQQLGTFTVLMVAPSVAFEDGNPLLLTLTGEFVVKNLVLLAGGLTLARRIRPMRTEFATASTGIKSRPHARRLLGEQSQSIG